MGSPATVARCTSGSHARSIRVRSGRIGGMTISFPRQSARTRRFTLGAPRGFQISPDGARVTFLRSRHGTDPVTCLWALDVDGTAEERLIVDPRTLDLPGEEDLPA